VRLLGFDISVKRVPREALSPVWGSRGSSGYGGWYPWVRESFPGAWQQNVTVDTPSVLAYHAVFACITLISSDIGKLRFKLVELDEDDIWSETESAAFSPVLRQPNTYQNHIQFKEWWVTSKLARGNAYALKGRDQRGVVTSLYLLDPCRCFPLVAPSGEVFYELREDNLANLEESVVVPASEIIHDRMNCLFHPLVGLSPIFACGLVATQGLSIQSNSSLFFQGMSRPGGILTAPGSISDATAARIKAYWEENFSGANFGRTAVLGDDLKYQPLTITAQDAQLIEQLKYTAEMVCSVFHVPPFKLGIGQMPTYQNAELLNSIYYSDCLQSQIEQMEACLDDGLGIGQGRPKEGRTLGVELDVASLLRMDTATAIDTLAKGVGGGIVAPNEARKRLDLPPVQGGDTPYLQQQNYSLEALDERDRNAPFAKPTPAAPPRELAGLASHEQSPGGADVAGDEMRTLDWLRMEFAP
jgi:HK97 family phage portal protein